MSSDNFLDEKRLKKLDRELQFLINKNGVDRKTQDEVFDKSTLKILEKMISDRVLHILDFPISTGKEGNVFRGVTPGKKLVAVKIYRTSTATFKHILKYILGDPRFNSIHQSRRDITFAWTKKEFKNLELLQKVGIKAPKPLVFNKNVLVMEYIGTKNKPAPLLKDVILKKPEEVLKILIDYIKIMYDKAGLVHGDLSAYNVLFHKNIPYIIDLGPGVLIEHPNSHEYLKRDIHNITNYFKKYNIKADERKIYNTVLTKKS